MTDIKKCDSCYYADIELTMRYFSLLYDSGYRWCTLISTEDANGNEVYSASPVADECLEWRRDTWPVQPCPHYLDVPSAEVALRRDLQRALAALKAAL